MFWTYTYHLALPLSSSTNYTMPWSICLAFSSAWYNPNGRLRPSCWYPVKGHQQFYKMLTSFDLDQHVYGHSLDLIISSWSFPACELLSIAASGRKYDHLTVLAECTITYRNINDMPWCLQGPLASNLIVPLAKQPVLLQLNYGTILNSLLIAHALAHACTARRPTQVKSYKITFFWWNITADFDNFANKCIVKVQGTAGIPFSLGVVGTDLEFVSPFMWHP